ncbi:MAG: cytidylyltransferase domain-containing protein [Bacteroidota bacterium]
MTYKILAIVPAREGSKRVPHKNFRPFAGSTLVDIALNQCLGSNYITDIVLTSDSKAVLDIGAKYPTVFGIQRPAEYSGDESPAIEYVRHALQRMESQRGYTYDMVVIIQPSSPLRHANDIDETIQLLARHREADSAVSVVKVAHMVHPLKLKVMNGSELHPFLEDEKGRFSAAQLPDIYVRNCAVYVTWRNDLETRSDVIGAKSVGYVMPPETSVDINEMIDFEFAEFIYKRKTS